MVCNTTFSKKVDNNNNLFAGKGFPGKGFSIQNQSTLRPPPFIQKGGPEGLLLLWSTFFEKGWVADNLLLLLSTLVSRLGCAVRAHVQPRPTRVCAASGVAPVAATPVHTHRTSRRSCGLRCAAGVGEVWRSRADAVGLRQALRAKEAPGRAWGCQPPPPRAHLTARAPRTHTHTHTHTPAATGV